MPHDVIATCPVCSGELAVTRLRCGTCGTTLEGEFSVGRFARLTREQTQVLESFLRSRGNLRDMERELEISYPTVRARVEALVRALGFGPRDEGSRRDRPGGRRRRRSPPPRELRPAAARSWSACQPRAERRGGRRGHPEPWEERPMTDTTAHPRRPRAPPGAGRHVEISLSSGSVRLRGTDAEQVVVRSRDGRALGDESRSMPSPAGSGSATASANLKVGPVQPVRPSVARPRHRRPGGRRPSACAR